MRNQLAFTGGTLGAGRIDLTRFLLVVRRTELCDPDKIELIDVEIADAIETREPMSMRRFQAMVDRIVAEHDPDAVRRRRELVDADRKVTIRPDRFTPGQSRVTGALPAEQAAAVDARLTAMAAAIHPDDPRTTAQRRADALVALANGVQRLTCRCEGCASTSSETPDEVAREETRRHDPTTDACAPEAGTANAGSANAGSAEPGSADASAETGAGETSTGAAGSCDAAASDPAMAPRPTFHIVVNLSTLLGLDDDPAFLDGHGVIDAATARGLVTEARRTYVRTDITNSPQAVARHTPGKKVDALVRAGELCCTFPGCDNPVWHADNDHTVPHGEGGATHPRNLKPLCRFHHRMKTFGVGWRDHQDELGTVFFQSPTGHTYLGNAFTGRDLFRSLTRSGPPPDHPARQRIDALRAKRAGAIRRADQRAMDRWNEQNPPPF